MLSDSHFSISLHAGIDRCIDFQSVGIYIIGFTVFLSIFVTPAIKGVSFPMNRILMILYKIPFGIVTPHRLFCSHIQSKELSEIIGNTLFMVSDMKVELERLRRIFLIFLFAEITLFEHLAQHNISSGSATFGISHGIKIGRIFAESD